MTEAQWLSSDDPAAMLQTVTDGRHPMPPRASARKVRLFAAACCRQVWPSLSPVSRDAVEVAELYADGRATAEELAAAHGNAYEDVVSPEFESELAWSTTFTGSGQIERHLLRWFSVSTKLARAQAALLREVVGNPFRPVTLPYYSARFAKPVQYSPNYPVRLDDDARCPWLTPTVLSLAQGAYEERLPDGTLEPARLAVLSDALEEAGCDNEPLLRHLRGWRPCKACPRENHKHRAKCVCNWNGGYVYEPGPHYRGCWAVDLVLGKG